MFIELSNIQELFADCRTFLRDSEPSHCLIGYQFLHNDYALYNSHILYIARDITELSKIVAPCTMHILVISQNIDKAESLCASLNEKIHILAAETNDAEYAIYRIQNFFDSKCGLGLFAESILEILFYEGGIQAMVDKAISVFQNPICVFDAGFHLIAANWEEASKTEHGRRMIENGGFTEEEFEIINHEHIHARIKKSETPIRTSHAGLGYEQMICIINTKKDVGHIVINAINRPFTNEDEKYLTLLKRAIDQQLKKDEFVRNNNGLHYEYFMKDLLDGKIATGKNNLERMNYTDLKFSGNLYCLVVETARSSDTLNTIQIRSIFEQSFSGTKTLLYNGEIVILLSFNNKSANDADYKIISDICQHFGLYAGISNEFNSITKLADYYKQALRAIELGVCNKNEPGLFIYQNFYMQHIANIFTQKESEKTFCHPKLQLLLDYDKAHDSELAYTLYMFLISERNVSAAADAMYMHRNTIIYRLKKIDSLVQIDYSSFHERQYLILSYELSKVITTPQE